MARKTKEESQKTRDGILDAAERVFLEKGVGTTAMADLADAAGVSRGAVYGHYKNKIEVCLAMCDRAFGQIEVPDENARVPALDILLRAGMGFLRQCWPARRPAAPAVRRAPPPGGSAGGRSVAPASRAARGGATAARSRRCVRT